MVAGADRLSIRSCVSRGATGRGAPYHLFMEGGWVQVWIGCRPGPAKNLVSLCGPGLRDLPVWLAAFVALSACVALACVARPCCVLGLCGLGLRGLRVWHSAFVAPSACVA